MPPGGSRGALDYRALARRRIAALMRSEVAKPDMFITMWENVQPEEKQFGGSRISDVSGNSFRAFAHAGEDPRWLQVLDRSYSLVDALQRQHSPYLGILPDFAVAAGSAAPQPAAAGFLGGKNDGAYGYNACRLPWRLALDHLLHGEKRAYVSARRLNAGLRALSGGAPRHLLAGYTLTGRPVRPEPDLAYSGPAAVGAMLDVEHPDWLAALYQDLLAVPLASGRYYGNTLKLLSLIVLTGHARAP